MLIIKIVETIKIVSKLVSNIEREIESGIKGSRIRMRWKTFDG